jgi:hypothetical protein
MASISTIKGQHFSLFNNSKTKLNKINQGSIRSLITLKGSMNNLRRRMQKKTMKMRKKKLNGFGQGLQ